MTDERGDRNYRRDDDARLVRIESGVEALTVKLDAFVVTQENRVTRLETNAKWAGVIAGLVATFVSSVLLLFVMTWMKR